MWNPFKKSKQVSLLPGTNLKSVGGNRVVISPSDAAGDMYYGRGDNKLTKLSVGTSRKCIKDDPDVTTVAGYLDNNKNFHATKETALKANADIKRMQTFQRNKAELTNILSRYDSYVSHWEITDLAERIVKDPKALRDFLNTLQDGEV